MLTGNVKWFNIKKGYGFITCDSMDVDYFVHYKDINMENFKVLKPRQRVQFDTYDGKNGVQAGNVTVIE